MDGDKASTPPRLDRRRRSGPLLGPPFARRLASEGSPLLILLSSMSLVFNQGCCFIRFPVRSACACDIAIEHCVLSMSIAGKRPGPPSNELHQKACVFNLASVRLDEDSMARSDNNSSVVSFAQWERVIYTSDSDGECLPASLSKCSFVFVSIITSQAYF